LQVVYLKIHYLSTKSKSTSIVSCNY